MASPDRLDQVVERIVEAAVEFYREHAGESGAEVYVHFDNLVRDDLVREPDP